MDTKLIQALIPYLPRFAEEEGDFFSVKRTELIQPLINQGYTQEVAENTLAILESLLDTLATLKPDYLQKGEWCFISFPAQLMALSVLTAMSDTNSRFFEANFWNTQGISNDKKEQQREVLKQLETQRQQSHRQQKATPIRYIHVAWSLIKHEGKILFYQREDTKKWHDNKAGDYGLVGGRVNQQDMTAFSGELSDKLKALQSPQVDLIKPALEQTLKRELSEEVGLCYQQHYTFKPWRELKPYQQVQGSAPNHALTEYFLNLYAIELTLEGFCFLQQQIQKDDRLVWFTLDEVTQGNTNDGRMAYIKALFADFSDDRTALKQALLALEDSFSANYLFKQHKYAISLPQTIETPIFLGVLGKESALEISLNSAQLALLLGLAAHCRGFKLINCHPDIEFYPYGWIKVQENTALQTDLIQLTQYFSHQNKLMIESHQNKLIIESQKDSYFRFSVAPEMIFFDDGLFSFSLNQADLEGVNTKVACLIKRGAITTALGMIEKVEKKIWMTLELATDLHELTKNQYSNETDFAEKIRNKYRKSKLQSNFSALGMRGLIRQDGGMLSVYCELESHLKK